MTYKRLAKILIIIFSVIFCGTIGYHIIEGWSFTEALYMTIITISTVGFGEVRPLSPAGKIFTIVLILSGIATLTTSASFIFSTIMAGTFAEVYRRQRMVKKLANMKNHFIICGVGAVGEDVLNEFIRAKAPFILVEQNESVLSQLLHEHPDIVYVLGNATNDETLKNAQIEHAKGLIAVLGNDADNLYICLTARSLNPKLRIIARVIESESIDKLKKAGADYVFSPEKIGGVRLASAALKPTVTSFLDAILRGEYFNLMLDEVVVGEHCSIAGKTLKESEISKNIHIIIPAIKPVHETNLIFNPNPDTIINPGAVLITFGTPEQIKQLKIVCTRKRV